jgi:hypothetical protein
MDHSCIPDIRLRRTVVPTDVESPTMGYKNHYYNLNLRSKIISVLPDAKIHTMGYKDHSSNPDIIPIRIVVHGTSTICQPRPFCIRIMSVH